MKITWQKDKSGIIGMVFFTVLMFTIAIGTHGTCEEGDSVYHYLFAKYALIHPSHFFHHWAKPFYVLVSFPLSQFGFIGIKLLNTTLSCVAIWYTYLIARWLEYRWASAVFIIAIFFKSFMIVTFSGLTEPLHDMMISVAIYLTFTKRYVWAAIILSFLPFVRSEGLFLCGIFGLYFILLRQWRMLPLLLTGHIVYSLAGYPFYHDILWVFTRIPYAGADGHYGHGTWIYFAQEMPTIAGLTNTILLTAGTLFVILPAGYLLIFGRRYEIRLAPLFLCILFLVFFGMHTTFWALGIFGSFGITRVFVAIACVMILIMLSAIEYTDSIFSRYQPYSSVVLLVVLLTTSIYIAMGQTRYAYFRVMDFELHPDQRCDREAADYIIQHYPDYKNYRFFFDAAYLGEVLQVDVFDDKNFRNNDNLDPAGYPNKSIIIWDDWYSASEHNIPIEKLRANPAIHEVKTFQKENPWGGFRTVVLFVRN